MVKTNSDGKLSLDMLIGLSIFLVTFIFIAQLLPSVFADVRREITLAHEAYKVTVMLSEMRGMWSDGMNSGVDWENRQICNDAITFLPGLSEGEPDFLSLEKVLKFNEFANQCPEKFRKALGLDVSNVYFHVSIESLISTPYKRIPVKYRDENGVRNLLDAGYPLPEGGFVKYERYIWLRPDVNLLGVLDLNTGGKRRACPTTQCDCSRVNIAQEADCSFNLTYPLKEFYVIVYDIYSHGQGESSSISICVDKEEKSGTCSVGSKNVSVQIDKYEISADIPPRSELPTNITSGIITKGGDGTDTFLKFVNDKLKELGVEEGQKVYLRVSFKSIHATVVTLDQTMPTYIAGKAAAKLVVYAW